MAYPSIHEPATNAELLRRIDALSPAALPLWGRMTVSQMLMHCCMPYRSILHPKERESPSRWTRLMGRLFFKRIMTGTRDYRRGLPTGKAFVVTTEPAFGRTRERLKGLLTEVHGMGEARFEGMEHPLIGTLSARQWSNLLYKHLDHHLRQFGV